MLTADEAIEAEIKGPTQGHTDDLLSSQKVKFKVSVRNVLTFLLSLRACEGGSCECPKADN